MNNKNKGITLVALIVNIILLLTLAAVTLYAIFGNTGLMDKTIKAQENYEDSQYVEIIELAKGNTIIKIKVNQIEPKYFLKDIANN